MADRQMQTKCAIIYHMDEVSVEALKAAEDAAYKESFIRDSGQTILRIASVVSGRYVTTSDDEWSVALYAYNKAIDTYDESKGEFLPYVQVVIKRALADYYRKENRYANEIAYPPDAMTGEADDTESAASDVRRAFIRVSEDEARQKEEKSDLTGEITEVNERLKKYGFTFYDVADASPKAGKTKKECAKVIACILDDKDMTEAVEKTGRLPAVRLKSAARVSGKMLDRYRRYIVMAVIILNGEYPLLADYLQYVRKEGG